ncbi:MAG: hypothetical protein KatS3mg121_1114 [Gammaproteobacteria bacterium]|nr:MAG: hypothetical protein KatS3mg121_1114 [Gammaproteobacteria bacterium]
MTRPGPLQLAVRRARGLPAAPPRHRLLRWARAAWRDPRPGEVAVKLVGEAESQALNARYRGRDRPTNVLAFGLDPPDALGLPRMGDLVICVPVVLREAAEQGKSAEAHFAHMVVHGLLHLQGYDHIEEAERLEMEALERHILADLGFPDPYA